MPLGHYVWHNSGESSHLAPKTLQKLRDWRLPPGTHGCEGKPTVSSKPWRSLALGHPILRSHLTHNGKEDGLSNPDSEEPPQEEASISGMGRPHLLQVKHLTAHISSIKYLISLKVINIYHVL